ncbi:MAG: riboflavin kinase [bacterium]
MRISGITIEGSKEARNMGFKTANIRTDLNIDTGIYKGKTELEGETFLSAIYVGNYRPGILETHLIGFSGNDFYGKNILVDIEEKIRDDRSDLSEEDLKKLIAEDIKKICDLADKKNV